MNNNLATMRLGGNNEYEVTITFGPVVGRALDVLREHVVGASFDQFALNCVHVLPFMGEEADKNNVNVTISVNDERGSTTVITVVKGEDPQELVDLLGMEYTVLSVERATS